MEKAVPPTHFMELKDAELEDMRAHFKALLKAQRPRIAVAAKRDPRDSYARRDPRDGR